MKKYPCPCCGFLTYNVPADEDCGYICPVCFWENDPFITSDNEPSDSNHGITLKETPAKSAGCLCSKTDQTALPVRCSAHPTEPLFSFPAASGKPPPVPPTTRGAAAAAKPTKDSFFPAWWVTFLRRDRAGVLYARHPMPDVFSTTSAKPRKSPAAYVPP